jgi:hypothetical protein
MNELTNKELALLKDIAAVLKRHGARLEDDVYEDRDGLRYDYNIVGDSINLSMEKMYHAIGGYNND